MTYPDSIQLSWGTARVDVAADDPRLNGVLAHIFRAFLNDRSVPSMPSLVDSSNGEWWFAEVDGHAYRFPDLGLAVAHLEDIVGEKLLTDFSDGLLLHSSAVAKGDLTILMLGPSGSGKTTLSLELVRRGYRYITDEYVAVERDGEAIRPFPRGAVLKQVVGDLPEGDHVSVDGDRTARSYLLPRDRSDLECLPLRELWLVFPTRCEGTEVRVRELDSAEACTKMLPSVFSFEGRESVLWEPLSSIAIRAKACTLEYDNAASDLDVALELLERI